MVRIHPIAADLSDLMTVVVEKPFTPTSKEAYELIAIAKEEKRLLTVYQSTSTHPSEPIDPNNSHRQEMGQRFPYLIPANQGQHPGPDRRV